MGKRLLTCFAFATWCFINTWVELAQGLSPYFARYDPRITVALPVVVCEVALALLLLAAWEFFRRHGHDRLPHYLFLAACLAPLGITSVALLRLSPVDLVPLVRYRFFWPAALAVALVPVILALRRPEGASRIVRGLFLYSWPVLLLILFQAVRFGLSHSGAEFADGRFAAKLPGAPPVRVVWVVFDGLSRKIAFDERPAKLELPNFDRLRAESFFASAAQPPGNATELSMPSLIFAETITDVAPLGPAELRMSGDGKTGPFGWDAHPNVFDSARALGCNTALVGWSHPYGRVLNHSLTEAFWTAGWLNSGTEEPTDRQSLIANMGFRIRMQCNAFPLVGHVPGFFPGLRARLEEIKRFNYLLGHAEQIAGDPSIGLALIHLPVPHPPAVYDRRQRAMAPERMNSYLDSLALADRVLGALRRKMEQAQVWDETALVVSSDHGWRDSIWRDNAEWAPEDESLPPLGTLEVPFLVKMPHRHTPVVYAKPFSTVVTRAVIVRILEGNLTEASELPYVIEGRSVTAAPSASAGAR